MCDYMDHFKPTTILFIYFWAKPKYHFPPSSDWYEGYKPEQVTRRANPDLCVVRSIFFLFFIPALSAFVRQTKNEAFSHKGPVCRRNSLTWASTVFVLHPAKMLKIRATIRPYWRCAALKTWLAPGDGVPVAAQKKTLGTPVSKCSSVASTTKHQPVPCTLHFESSVGFLVQFNMGLMWSWMRCCQMTKRLLCRLTGWWSYFSLNVCSEFIVKYCAGKKTNRITCQFALFQPLHRQLGLAADWCGGAAEQQEPVQRQRACWNVKSRSKPRLWARDAQESCPDTHRPWTVSHVYHP